MYERLIQLLERRVQGRRFAFGPPTPEYESRLSGTFHVQRGQHAASVRWDTDGAERHVLVKVGPVGCWVTLARTRLVPDPKEPWCWLRSWIWRGREFAVWVNLRHVGVCVENDPVSRQRRVEVGPFGALVMPDWRPARSGSPR